MKNSLIITLFLTGLIFSVHAQNQDSIQLVTYQQALQKLKSNDLAAAGLQFTQLINSGFKDKEVYVKRGIVLFQQGEFDKARTDFDEAVKARINTQELYEYRGNAKYKLDDYQGASTDLDKAVTMGANSFETFSNLGNAKFRMDNFKEAILNYDKAVAAGKPEATLYKVKQNSI